MKIKLDNDSIGPCNSRPVTKEEIQKFFDAFVKQAQEEIDKLDGYDISNKFEMCVEGQFQPNCGLEFISTFIFKSDEMLKY